MKLLFLFILLACTSYVSSSNGESIEPIEPMPGQKIHSPEGCPKGMTVRSSAKGGMVTFVVEVNPDELAKIELYRGKVSAACHLEMSNGYDRIASTRLHAERRANGMTRFRLSISTMIAKTSHLKLFTRLHESREKSSESELTLGGSKEWRIALSGFLPDPE